MYVSMCYTPIHDLCLQVENESKGKHHQTFLGNFLPRSTLSGFLFSDLERNLQYPLFNINLNLNSFIGENYQAEGTLKSLRY